MNTAVFAKSECVNYLAKLEVEGGAPEFSEKTDMPYPKIDVIKIFNIFLHAVDQGQMKLFDKRITRNMLEPLRVEYIYTPEDPYPKIRVFSSLLEPFPMPAVPNVYIKGVSGVMDVNGNIIESIAHCDIEG